MTLVKREPSLESALGEQMEGSDPRFAHTGSIRCCLIFAQEGSRYTRMLHFWQPMKSKNESGRICGCWLGM